MKCIEEFRRKPLSVQKVLLVLMVCARENGAGYEIDYKKHCRGAMDKWDEAYARFAADCSEDLAAEKVIGRLADNLQAVMAKALEVMAADA
jgi:hypothetical protein